MSQLDTSPGLLLARGKIPGSYRLRKFGRNPAITTSVEDIWSAGNSFNWIQTAETIGVVSSDADDDGNPTTNTGAQTVTISGLDSSWNLAEETVTLNGTNEVTTTATFIRVFRAYVATTGTYHGTNEGNLTIEYSSSNVNAGYIATGRGQTEQAQYTVPTGYTGYLHSISAWVDANKTGDVTFWQCPNADDKSQPFSGAKRIVTTMDGVVGFVRHEFRAPLAFDAKTDIWASGLSDATGAEISVEFEMTMILNDAP